MSSGPCLRYLTSSAYLKRAAVYGHVNTWSESVGSNRPTRYQTTSEVVREALRLLERHEQEREEAFHQLKANLERGARQAERGELIDGDEVFDELREMIEGRRRARPVNQ